MQLKNRVKIWPFALAKDECPEGWVGFCWGCRGILTLITLRKRTVPPVFLSRRRFSLELVTHWGRGREWERRWGLHIGDRCALFTSPLNIIGFTHVADQPLSKFWHGLEARQRNKDRSSKWRSEAAEHKVGVRWPARSQSLCRIRWPAGSPSLCGYTLTSGIAFSLWDTLTSGIAFSLSLCCPLSVLLSL